MFDFLSAVVLGIVEGVTEFLPVSSTGHLILVGEWFSLAPGFAETFDIVIQLGAICAVLILFRRRLWPFGGCQAASAAFGTWKKTLVAVVPALALGALFGDWIQGHLFSVETVAVALIVGGVLLIVSEKMPKREGAANVEGMSYRTAFLVGIAQCLALVPGTSRSAATIIGALFLGVSRVAAVEFSFFLAVPTIAAASGYALLKGVSGMGFHEALVLATGFVVSFLVAWAVIRVFMKYVQTRDLVPFGYYRILVGILILSIM